VTRLRSWAGNLALVLLGVVVPLVLAEGLLRALDRSRPGGKEQVERNSYTEYDPVLGWRKTAGANVRYVRRDYRSTFRINAHGLRGPERSFEKPAGTLRVLALGDSFIEAFMVSDAEMVSTQIEARLRARLRCTVEVINGGTVGYSTDQEYLFYRDVGHRYGADVVILFTYHNDLPPLVRDRYHVFPKPILSFEEAPPKVANEPVPVYQAESPPPAAAVAPPAPPGSLLLEFVKDRIERGSARTYNRLASWGLWEPLRLLPENEELKPLPAAPHGSPQRRVVGVHLDSGIAQASDGLKAVRPNRRVHTKPNGGE
jgi:lysophospholipase L1-like esterase